jgi:hypothetical protein
VGVVVKHAREPHAVEGGAPVNAAWGHECATGCDSDSGVGGVLPGEAGARKGRGHPRPTQSARRKPERRARGSAARRPSPGFRLNGDLIQDHAVMLPGASVDPPHNDERPVMRQGAGRDLASRRAWTTRGQGTRSGGRRVFARPQQRIT